MAIDPAPQTDGRFVPRPVPTGGLTDLPAGMIAAIATYLEMTAPPPGTGTAPDDGDGRFAPIGGDLARYRRLYREVGEPWLWFSRAVISDAALERIISDPAVEALALVAEGRDVGMIELDFRKAEECELAFLGVVPDAIGRGFGRTLIRAAIRRAFARPIRRLWLHTCTLDHPGALAFYMKAGLRPYRRAVEIAQDPRLTGHMPRDAAPMFPIV